MSRDEAVRAHLSSFGEVLSGLDPAAISGLTEMLSAAWAADRAVLICGNGGSASTASHMACDLTKQTLVPGRRPLRAIALADSAALVTAWGNDAGFDRVFAEQVRVHGRPGDVLVCISCSGGSPNIVAAIDQARALEMSVAGLGGFNGGMLRQRADAYVHVDSEDYGLIESAHLLIEHTVAMLLGAHAAVAPGAAHPGTGDVVFVDRDGVINRNLPDSVRSWDDFEFLPGALEGIAALTAAGRRVVVITNQATVGRGHTSVAQLEEVHRRMREEVLEHGGRIEAVYACTHTPDDGCDCRKPSPGLLLRAARELELDPAEAVLIGDHQTDLDAAGAAGMAAILVLSGRTAHGQATAGDLRVAADLLEAAHILLTPDTGSATAAAGG